MQPPQVSLPPACADCQSLLQSSLPGVNLRQTPFTLLRSAEGKIRLDFGNRSLINDPKAGVAFVLDHLKMEATRIPIAQLAGRVPQVNLPGVQLPGMPANLPRPEDLGRKLIDGHDVLGKLYTIHLPQPPQLPPKPQLPHSLEVWTSAQLHLPVLSTITGGFGRQVIRCKCTATDHPPAQFQVPPGYKVLDKTQ